MQSALNWNELISTLPNPHIMQTSQWGDLKRQHGWQAHRRVWIETGGEYLFAPLVPGDSLPAGAVKGAALILSRSLKIASLNLQVMYVPKGPLLDWDNRDLRWCVLADLASLARSQGALFIKIDPDLAVGYGFPGWGDDEPAPAGMALQAELAETGWVDSAEQIQFRNTVLLNLAPELDALLSNMKQKTRYNIRLAERKGVSVREGSAADIPMLFQMYAETSIRDGFVIRDGSYYEAVWGSFLQAGMADLLIAESQGEILAGLILFHFAGRAWYFYGMSSQRQREKMPNYLLQWEAICRARDYGCKIYDLWGAPDKYDEADPLWRVYQFKKGLGGRLVRWIGAWDYPVRPGLYRFYTEVMPRILEIMRRRGRDRARQAVGV